MQCRYTYVCDVMGMRYTTMLMNALAESVQRLDNETDEFSIPSVL